MAYNIDEILDLPTADKKAIVDAILKNLGEEDNQLAEDDLTLIQAAELDRRFAEIESGNYMSYTLDEVKQKLSEEWLKK